VIIPHGYLWKPIIEPWISVAEHSAEACCKHDAKRPLLTSNGKDMNAAQSCTDGFFVSERRSGINLPL
jgi:hypothetical protein